MTRTLNFTAGAVIGALFTLLSAFAGMDAADATASVEWHACKYEDGSGQKRCIWDARHMGNGEGHSLKIINGGEDDARYIRISHRKAHRLAGI